MVQSAGGFAIVMAAVGRAVGAVVGLEEAGSAPASAPVKLIVTVATSQTCGDSVQAQ